MAENYFISKSSNSHRKESRLKIQHDLLINSDEAGKILKKHINVSSCDAFRDKGRVKCEFWEKCFHGSVSVSARG